MEFYVSNPLNRTKLCIQSASKCAQSAHSEIPLPPTREEEGGGLGCCCYCLASFSLAYSIASRPVCVLVRGMIVLLSSSSPSSSSSSSSSHNSHYGDGILNLFSRFDESRCIINIYVGFWCTLSWTMVVEEDRLNSMGGGALNGHVI